LNPTYSKANLALNQSVAASSFQNPYLPSKAVTGLISEAERWLPSRHHAGPHWFVVELQHSCWIGSAVLHFWRTGSPDDGVRFQLEYEAGEQWLPVPGGFHSREYSQPVILEFHEPVFTSKVRILFRDAWLSLSEFQLYPPGAAMEAPRSSGEPVLEQVRKNADFDPNVKVLVSQFGYHPEHKKKVVYLYDGSTNADTFELFDVAKNRVVYMGRLKTVEDDFGRVQTGDFTDWTDEGEYFIRIGNDRSYRTFRIQTDLWGEYQRLIALQYFGARRVGEDSIVGDYGDTIAVRWDDARSADGSYRYIGKGFADGDDLRRFANASLLVAQYCMLKHTEPYWDSSDWIYNQVRWGLDGVLSFLGKDGLLKHGLHIRTPDIHYGTDGLFESGDEGLLIDPIRDQEENAYEYNTINEEVIHTSLLLGPAEACLLYYDKDPEFFERVKQLVIRGCRNIQRRFGPYPHKYSLSAWAWLNALLYRMTGEDHYRETAVAEANRFIGLQVTEWHGDAEVQAKGWYRYIAHPEQDPWAGTTPRYGKFTALDSETRSPWGEKPEQEIMIIPWIYQGLFRLLDLFPDDPAAERWSASVQAYVRDYLQAIAKQNVYGLTPMKVGRNGLIRQKGTLSYQYHGEIGRMFHQLANGALMMKAGKQFGVSSWVDAGWEHAYYFTGMNPLGVGAIYGLSSNIPSQQYLPDSVGKAYPGAVCNGFNCISGSNDHPQFQYWEFYGYANLASLWFATELGCFRAASGLELWPRELREAQHTSSPDEHPRHRLPVRMKGGFTYRFTSWGLSADKGDAAQEWLVNGVVGGTAEAGWITEKGAYTAPEVSEETIVTVAVRLKDGSAYSVTRVTIMPVPSGAIGLHANRLADGAIQLTWNTAHGNVSGYTIWMRTPVTENEAGTIFERIGFTGDKAETNFRVAFPCAPGTQFQVRAYYRSQGKNYGYGPESTTVTLK
jgi:hypothetical protein